MVCKLKRMEKNLIIMGIMNSKNISVGITGLALIGVGILCILKPGSAILSMSWLIGLLILMSGTATLFRWLSVRTDMIFGGSILLSAVFQIILGLMFINHNAILLSTFSIILAIGLLFEGLSLTTRALEYRKYGVSRWPMTLALGVGSMFLGFWCFGSPVLAGGTIISTVLGICLVVAGCIYLSIQFGLLKFKRWMKNSTSNYQDPWVDEQ